MTKYPIIVIDEHDSTDKKHERTTLIFAIWRLTEVQSAYVLSRQLQFRPTYKSWQKIISSAFEFLPIAIGTASVPANVTQNISPAP